VLPGSSIFENGSERDHGIGRQDDREHSVEQGYRHGAAIAAFMAACVKPIRRRRPFRPSASGARSTFFAITTAVPAARAGGSADQLCDSAQPRLTLQTPHELEPSRNTGALVAIPLSGSEPLTSLLR
jgi:hypothetical protein